MPLRIVRNDITKMNTEAIVNTAGSFPVPGPGCDAAIYAAAGDELNRFREKIGTVPEGDVFISPGFDLPAEYIIHAVSPAYIDGNSGEEEKLRSCYMKSLMLAQKNGIRSIAFPLISTGSFGYPKEEGINIAIEEISAFLSRYDMDITLVVFDPESVRLTAGIYPDLEEFISSRYVEEKTAEEYGDSFAGAAPSSASSEPREKKHGLFGRISGRKKDEALSAPSMPGQYHASAKEEPCALPDEDLYVCAYSVPAAWGSLDERMRHILDPFGEYLLYIIEEKGMTNAEVYKRALITKQSFGKLKKNPGIYHPDKITALQYCVGAKLNLDETKDMLARAGYALSPADKRDIIDIDIALEEHGIPCIIK